MGQVRLAVARGDLPAVERWVRDCSLSVEEEIPPLLEEESITLARALLVLGKAGAAVRLLARLLDAVKRGGRLGRGIEIQALQALAHRAQGVQDRALAALTEAVGLAEPEGYLRTFLDEGEPMASLLLDLRSHLAGQVARTGDRDPGRLQAYVGELLAAFAVEAGMPSALGSERARVAGAGLVEPLSERELEVLRLVAAGLTNQAIADRLFIAVSTVKSHTNSIYGKLGVRNRTQPIAQARAMDLL
jgi:LuxR family maltose regulon positive regulatory protein